ncbi:MAG: T9SS type A sorting domain-containing protein [Flavobacteriales bacterium]|nr:T9SS type A sorting domain-containing protein [Flavobacteriales bacterium]
MTLGTQVQDDVCDYGSGCINAYAIGGTAPYSFFWSPVPPTGQGTQQACGLFAGSYSITVFDSNGDSQTIEATVNSTPNLLFDTTPSDAIACVDPCNGYWSRSVSMGGVAPYTITVDPPAGAANANPNGVEVYGMCVGGSYTFTIEDANGCSAVISGVEVVQTGPPEVVSITQQGFCQGFPSGSAQVTFDQDLSQVTVVSGTSTVNVVGNTVYLYGLVIGFNVFNAIGASPFCQNQFMIEVLDETGLCGTIEGAVIADVDENCQVDPTDPPVPYHLLRVQPGNYFAITNADGTYTKGAAYGSHTIASEVIGTGTDCMAQHPVPVSMDADQPTATADFLVTPLFGPDASANIGAGWFRPGFSTTITASARNNNAFPISDVRLVMEYDPLLTFDYAVDAPAVNTSGHLEWVLPTLQPYETIYRYAILSTPNDAGLIGANVELTATLSMSTVDAEPLNDSYSTTRTIFGSWDPNDKLVRTSSRTSESEYYTDLDDHVDYTIRFQNTGTAEAINVYLLDTISARFDLASFEFLGTSHPVEVSFEDDRVLRFDYPNILLPDSGADLLGSQGFVSFRLKPVDDLLIGEALNNAADIYFDFNEPVRTNTATLTVDMSSGISSHTDVPVVLSPNPAHDRIRITGPSSAGFVVEVIDLEGRLVIPGERYVASSELNVSTLATGMYILRMIDDLGARHQTRFVKH